MGQPLKDRQSKEEKLAAQAGVRFTQAEFDRLYLQAKSEHRSLASYLRILVLEAEEARVHG